MKKGRFLLGLFFVTLAIVITLFSFSNITGFVIIENLGQSMVSIIALVFLIGGLLIGISSTQEEQEAQRQYNTFTESAEQVYTISELAEKRNDPRLENKRAADKKLRGIAHGYLAPQIRALITPEQLTPQQIEANIQAQQAMSKSISANLLYQNAYKITSQISDSNLEELVTEEPIIASVQKRDKKEKEVFGVYLGIKKAKDLLRKYKKGDPLDEEEQEQIRKYLSVGAGLAQEKKLREAGFEDPDILSLGRSLGETSGKFIDPRKAGSIIEPGINESIKQTNALYEELSKTSGKNVYQITRETLADMAKGSQTELELATRYTLGAAKGKVSKYRPSRN